MAVGTELLLGQIVDTNSAWIGQRLAEAGVDCLYQTRVGDNFERIAEVLRTALGRNDAVIVCGGLGPTPDDITRDVIAAVLGVELVPDPVIAARIRHMFESRGRTMAANNLRQAEVPRGCATIAQQPGTAPGLICPVEWPGGRRHTSDAGEAEAGTAEAGTEEKVIYAVPGVPREMREMVAGTVVPDLRRRSGDTGVIRSRVLRTWGLSESALAERLDDRITELDRVPPGDTVHPTIAFLASGVEGIKVRITVKAPDDTTAEAALATEEEVVRSILGDIVFGVDDDTMESVVLGLLVERGLTVAVAESVTGGYLAGRLTAVPGASREFRGGVVAYDPEVKFGLLGVRRGPVVNDGTAAAMAVGVRKLLGADVGLGLTGVAGPDPLEGHPPGTVHMGMVVGPDHGAEAWRVVLPGDRERIRQFSCITILDRLRRRLAGLPPYG